MGGGTFLAPGLPGKPLLLAGWGGDAKNGDLKVHEAPFLEKIARRAPAEA
jgi:hypothetical protein